MSKSDGLQKRGKYKSHSANPDCSSKNSSSARKGGQRGASSAKPGRKARTKNTSDRKSLDGSESSPDDESPTWVDSTARTKIGYDKKVEKAKSKKKIPAHVSQNSDILVVDGNEDKEPVPARVLEIKMETSEFNLHFYQKEKGKNTWRLIPMKSIFWAHFDDFVSVLTRVTMGSVEGTRQQNRNVAFKELI